MTKEIHPAVKSFVQFIMGQDINRPIDHSSWGTCAAGEYYKSKYSELPDLMELERDLLDILRRREPDLHRLLNWGSQFADFKTKDDLRHYYWTASSEFDRLMIGENLPHPSTKIKNYGDLQACLFALFPELL